MRLPLAAALSAALLLAACSAPGTPDDDATVIVASTNVWGAIAQAVAGPDVEVVSVIDDPAADPHEFEADARVQLALAKADIVIANGGGYDDFIGTMLSASGNTTATVITATDLSPSADTGNEHVWYDYGTVGAVAEAIAHALPAAPGLAGLQSGLAALEQRVAELAPSAAGKTVAITEPVPLYLTDAIGLENVTPDEFSEAIEEDTDAPAGVLQDTLDLFSAAEPPVALVENAQTGGPQVDQVIAAAEAAGVPVIPVTETLPAGEDYLSWQGSVIDAIEGALRS